MYSYFTLYLNVKKITNAQQIDVGLNLLGAKRLTELYDGSGRNSHFDVHTG